MMSLNQTPNKENIAYNLKKNSTPFYSRVHSESKEYSECSTNSSILDSAEKFETRMEEFTRNEGLVIDVKRKRRQFANPMDRINYVKEYTKKLKTEMCKTWALTGTCRFGTTCSFAHGEEEIRSKNHLHSNFKTKPCSAFYTSGLCPYGYRCQYIHHEILYHPQFRSFYEEFVERVAPKNERLNKIKSFCTYSSQLSESIKQGKLSKRKNGRKLAIFSTLSGQNSLVQDNL